LFGEISGSVNGGVFEFTKLDGLPGGVILQSTGLAVAANEILTATFQLGNLTAQRRRVTVILHDAAFGDLSACTFWLAPNQPLSDYTYRTFATQAWSNLTLSVYPATISVAISVRLDNVTLQRTPSAVISGTECLEPGSSVVALSAASGLPASRTRRQLASARSTGPLDRPEAPGVGAAPAGGGAVGLGAEALREASWIEQLTDGVTVDLTRVGAATLHLESWLSAAVSRGIVQVSADGVAWDTVHVIGTSEAWTDVAVDLGAYAGEVIQLRFVLDATMPAPGEIRDAWFIRGLRVTTSGVVSSKRPPRWF
jgi:hypothetical protein